MSSTHRIGLAVSALAVTILSSASASADPLAYNDTGFPFPAPVFQQVVREPAVQPAYHAVPDQNVTEESYGVVDPRFPRQTIAYNTTEAPGTIIIDTPHTYLYY